ncbi:MAG: hypothetical protein CL902_01120 [Dehalococcoidia bacterium]|nr:hypothetical protein [Dehalococcoidia bacterium]
MDYTQFSPVAESSNNKAPSIAGGKAAGTVKFRNMSTKKDVYIARGRLTEHKVSKRPTVVRLSGVDDDGTKVSTFMNAEKWRSLQQL